MSRLSVLFYGTVAYLLFFATFVYAVLFVEEVLVPRTLSSGGTAGATATAVLVNLGLMSLFAVQHSVMARRSFKARWTRVIPPAAERPTYVLATVVVLNLLFFFWRPIPAVVWAVDGIPALLLTALSWAGFGLVLVSTFVIDHFGLFGLRQVVRHYRGLPAAEPPFQVRAFYRWIRHPLYLGFFIAFWSAPVMTVSHLLFAAVVTAYVLLAVQLEERDLIAEHGAPYREYRARVPMILPLGRRRAPAPVRRAPAARPETTRM